MFHFCADEVMMLIAAIPFLGAIAHRIHAWYLKKFPKHSEHCHDHRQPSPVDPPYTGPQSMEDFASHAFQKGKEDE